MNVFLIVLFLIIGLAAGFALGIFISRRETKKVMLENPPLNEDAIRTMMSNMGRKPSEAQVQQTLRQIRGAAKAQEANKKKR